MRKIFGGFTTDLLTLRKAGKRILNQTRNELSEYYNDHWHNFGNKPIDYEMTEKEANCSGECGSTEPQLYTDEPKIKPRLKWVPLSQKKPPPMEYVLVYTTEQNIYPSVTMARLTMFGQKWSFLKDKNSEKEKKYYEQHLVSHWMYLPEKPE